MIRSLLKSATSIPSYRFGLAVAYSLRDLLPRQVAIDCLVEHLPNFAWAGYTPSFADGTISLRRVDAIFDPAIYEIAS